MMDLLSYSFYNLPHYNFFDCLNLQWPYVWIYTTLFEDLQSYNFCNL